jgi:hypothetical protein
MQFQRTLVIGLKTLLSHFDACAWLGQASVATRPIASPMRKI